MNNNVYDRKISETDKSIVLCDKISLSLIFNDMSDLTKYGSDKQRFWLKFIRLKLLRKVLF
jgi:hypothetical protein